MFVDIAEKKWENCVRGFMKKLLGIVVLGLLWCNVSFASCYEAMITTPTPFMGNHGEIFKLDDGTIWEVQFEYEYLYE